VYSREAYLDFCLLFARATLLVFGWLARLGLFCGHGAGRDEASPVSLDANHQQFGQICGNVKAKLYDERG
jgi:hypothetical protein